MRREPLIQWRYRRSPWKLLVACILLNRTRGKVARPVIEEVLRRWPTPSALSGADTDELEDAIRCLGLQTQRAYNLKYMSREYPRRRMTSRSAVMQLAGCGEYAADAYALLVLGDLRVDPKDKELKRWREWAVENPPRWAKKIPMNTRGTVDTTVYLNKIMLADFKQAMDKMRAQMQILSYTLPPIIVSPSEYRRLMGLPPQTTPVGRIHDSTIYNVNP